MDVLKLYEPMMKSIIRKYLEYANKVGLDYDDLFQEASMTVLQAEITANLDKKKADVMILKYFHNLPNSYIEKVMNISSISSTITSSRLELIRKSLLFRNEYRRIHHIDEYDTERLALLDS